MSDVKREKELAERRKNDPALNQTQDHLVRKLFSKFKKGPMGNSTDLSHPRDLERGDSFALTDNGVPPGVGGLPNSNHHHNNNHHHQQQQPSNGGGSLLANAKHHLTNNKVGASDNLNGTNSTATTTTLSVDACDVPVVVTKPSPRKGGGGWARLKGGGGGGGGGAGKPKEPEKKTPPNDVEPKPKTSDSRANSEEDNKSNSGISQQEYHQIMKNMAEFKVDMKQEIVSMNKKISKMEVLMTDFIGKLNSALPAAAAAAAAASEEERHHRRSHGKSKNRERSRSKHKSNSNSNIKQMLEDEINSQSPKREHFGGGITYVPGQKEEFL